MKQNYLKTTVNEGGFMAITGGEYEKMANYEFDDITADYGLLLNLVSKYAV